MKNIAIVTVTYNAEKNLTFFLPSLVKNSEAIDAVYFVDNCSKDATLNTLQSFKTEGNKHFPIRITGNTQNYGYAYAINLGIQQALDDGFEYICVTNNDIIFEEGFFAEILDCATKNNIDALGVPASINDHELGFGYTLDPNTYLPQKDPPTKREELMQKIIKSPLPAIGFPHGGTILFHRRFFETIGLYDPNLFFGGDELDFLYRVTKYNESYEQKIKCAVSLKSFQKLDNFTKHNSGDKFIKAKKMLQGSARVNLKHRFTPAQLGLYKEQYRLIKNLSRGILLRYIILYFFALRGLCIEIYKYYLVESK